MMNQIKLIIFDLDGTLYNLDDVVAMNYQMQLDFYSTYSGLLIEDVVKTFEENSIYPRMSEKSKSATEFFVEIGVPAAKWNEYREKQFDVSAIIKENAVSRGLMEKFSGLTSLVLLSSNSFNNISRILSHIGIPMSIFSEIVCSDNRYGEEAFRKIDEMRLIADRNNIMTEEMLSIGDRYKTDIEPLTRLGGCGIVVSGPMELPEVYEAVRIKDFSGLNYYRGDHK